MKTHIRLPVLRHFQRHIRPLKTDDLHRLHPRLRAAPHRIANESGGKHESNQKTGAFHFRITRDFPRLFNGEVLSAE